MTPPATSASETRTVTAVSAWLARQIAGRLGISVANVDLQMPFATLGLSSKDAVALVRGLQDWLGRELSPAVIYSYPTIASLAEVLGDAQGPPAAGPGLTSRSLSHAADDHRVAIVGIGCRFPGACGPGAFWKMLCAGRDATREIPLERWYGASRDKSGSEASTVQRGGFLDQIDQFDSAFFGISPREAAFIDPQQRLLLELAWETLEHAGQPPTALAGSRTGVFIGASSPDWAIQQFSGQTPGDAFKGTGAALALLANRISYVFDFRGPSLVIDTACSSSLIAIHQACQSLRRREADVALAGGVNIILSPLITDSLSRANMLAPDGRCKTFDERADGYARGEGGGLIVLKRLQDAVAAGDPILAVIRGSAVNQDGRSNGLTAPNGLAQEAVVRAALLDAGVEAAAIGYVEAHGTGTALGDPVEIEALWNVLGSGRPADQPLFVGAVKSNIGHLESAAGLAGLIKTVLCLEQNEIPPSLHLHAPNRLLKLEARHLRIPTQRQPWPRGSRPRYAGVSSFGFGGANAHLIIEEGQAAVATPPPSVERTVHLLTLSARSETALESLRDRMYQRLAERPDESIADLAFSANTGRAHLTERMAVVAASRSEFASKMTAAAGPECHGVVYGRTGRGQPKVAYLFTGQGAQHAGMGRQLYETSPSFRKTLDHCERCLAPFLDTPLRDLLFSAKSSEFLRQTKYAQPALFALQYAIAQLWISWGIAPDACLGHSLGEFAAAAIAGAMTFEEGLRLVARRGALMQSLAPGGEMAAIFTGAERVHQEIAAHNRVAIAAYNGPTHIVISGPAHDIALIRDRCAEDGIRSITLGTSHAFHSPLVEPILPDWERAAANVRFEPPRVELISNLTGRPVDRSTLADPGYWRKHAREPVRFAAGMEYLAGEGYTAFVEMGPASTLIGMAQGCLHERDYLWLPSLRAGHGDWQILLESLSILYVNGADVDWRRFDEDYSRNRLSLPNYPFERSRHWSLPTPEPSNEMDQPEAIDKYLYELNWRPAAALAKSGKLTGVWLILSNGELGASIVHQLARLGATCVTVLAGSSFRRFHDQHFEINPASSDHFDRLLHEIGAAHLYGVLQLWPAEGPDTNHDLEKADVHGCGAALNLLSALAKCATPARLWIVTRGMVVIEGDRAAIPPVYAGLWGMGRSIGLELPQRWGALIDLDPDAASPSNQRDFEALVVEIAVGSGEDQVALRGGRRWVPRLGRLAATAGTAPLLEGTYLITGGLGGLGLMVAQHLGAAGARRLGLLSRRGLESHREAAATIELLRARGIEVHVLSGDVTDQASLTAAVAQLEQVGSPLRGIVHAAGVAGYRSILEITAEEWDDVVRAKFIGGWNLHQLSRERPIDLFIMFSSISAIWGAAKQSHYAAANAYLDSLVAWRRSQGLPGQSIAWGPWSGVGMMPTGAQNALSQIGIDSLKAKLGLALFKRLLRTPTANPIAAEVDWATFRPIYAAASGRRVFDELPVDASSAPQRTARSDRRHGELRRQLRELGPAQPFNSVLNYVRQTAARILRLKDGELPDPERLAKDLGFDSLLAVEFARALGSSIEAELPATLLFEHPTLAEVANRVCLSLPSSTDRATLARQARNPVSEPIAIVGMACRLPGGVHNADSYWQLLCNGVDAIREVPAERWDINQYYDPDPDAIGKMNSRWGGFIDDVRGFDADFFGISAHEAMRMDPQQRLLLELAWEALEDAGVPASQLRGKSVGVFLGISSNEYGMMLHRDEIEADIFTPTGSAISIAANRLSFVFDFRGPSMAVDTACSSSLVAIHLACQSLRSGESQMALAAGINLLLSPLISVNLAKSGLLAPDGRCRSFDAKASGYVRSEGAAVIALKPLSAASRDGDRIYALIAGTAVNQDGRSNGLTAPNRQAQEDVLLKAYADAQIAPGRVRYVEAHGTGTPLGDPIEVRALSNVMNVDRPAGRACALGSVKTNLGHTEAAAGVTALVKVALCLHHRRLPKTLHYREANPHIGFSDTPLRVQETLGPWPAGDGPLVAGVSSFGFGGTNAHAVLLEAEPGQSAPASLPSGLAVLPLSARSRPALHELAGKFRTFLLEHPDADLGNIYYSAGVRRDHHDFRLAIASDTRIQLIRNIDAFLSGTPSEDVTTGRKAPGPRPHLNFVFADARETWWGMGRRLFASERLFADVISECDRHLREAGVGRSLVAQMNLDETHADEPGDAASALTCVILQIALARLWQSWGVKPDAIVGAGLGEVAAAHIAGVLTLRDALSATLIRAGIPTDTFQPGPIPGKPTIPIYLSSAGRLLAAEDLTNDYWKHAAENGTPYSQGLYPLLEEQTGDFLQMGPGVSEAIVQDPQKCKLNGRVLSSWQRYENEPSTMIKTLSALYARGHDIDWNKVYQFGAFVRLPGYPWQHQDYWISQAPPISRVGAKVPAGALSAPIELAEPAGRHMWTGQIRSQDLIALNCAPFDGTILVPVGVFIERALWAARDLFENAACAVAQVDFPEPLFLTCEGSALLQIYMSRMGPQEADFEIYCRIDREFGRWARHAKGRVRVKTKLPNATASDIKCSSGPDRSPAGRTV